MVIKSPNLPHVYKGRHVVKWTKPCAWAIIGRLKAHLPDAKKGIDDFDIGIGMDYGVISCLSFIFQTHWSRELEGLKDYYSFYSRWTSPMGVECACISTYLLERQHPRLPHGWLKMSGSLGYPHLWDGWAIVVGCIGNPNVRKVTPSQCSIVNIIVTTCVSVQEINKHAISITNTREVYFSIHFCSGRLTFNPFMRVFHRIFANATQIGVMCKSNW